VARRHCRRPDPPRHQKALAWDDKRAQDRHNIELGWQLEFTVEPAAPGNDPKITVDLVDADGAPLEGAHVSLEAFSNARADERLTVQLLAIDDQYEITLPMRGDGLWEFRFTVTRGDELFTHTNTRHVWTELPE